MRIIVRCAGATIVTALTRLIASTLAIVAGTLLVTAFARLIAFALIVTGTRLVAFTLLITTFARLIAFTLLIAAFARLVTAFAIVAGAVAPYSFCVGVVARAIASPGRALSGAIVAIVARTWLAGAFTGLIAFRP